MNSQSSKKRKLSTSPISFSKNKNKNKNNSNISINKIRIKGGESMDSETLLVNVNLMFKMDEMMKEIQKLNDEIHLQKKEISELNNKILKKSQSKKVETKAQEAKKSKSEYIEYFYIS